MYNNVKYNTIWSIVLGVIFVFVAFALQPVLYQKKAVINLPIEAAYDPSVAVNELSPMETIPAVTVTQTQEGSLLPEYPKNFPNPNEGNVVSSYTGTVSDIQGKAVYGAQWLFPDETIGEVLEDFIDEEKYPHEIALVMNWIFDETPDPLQTQIQRVRGHNKQGDYFWITVTQVERNVRMKLDLLSTPS